MPHQALRREWQPGHNVCTVIWRRSETTGIIELLTVRSRTTFRGKTTVWRIKFPGGGQEGPKEPIEGTRDREVWQETHLSFMKSEQIWINPVNPEHTRYGYLVAETDCSGELRRDFLKEGDDELESPLWKDASTLYLELYEKHQALLLAALRKLGLA